MGKVSRFESMGREKKMRWNRHARNRTSQLRKGRIIGSDYGQSTSSFARRTFIRWCATNCSRIFCECSSQLQAPLRLLAWRRSECAAKFFVYWYCLRWEWSQREEIHFWPRFSSFHALFNMIISELRDNDDGPSSMFACAQSRAMSGNSVNWKLGHSGEDLSSLLRWKASSCNTQMTQFSSQKCI